MTHRARGQSLPCHHLAWSAMESRSTSNIMIQPHDGHCFVSDNFARITTTNLGPESGNVVNGALTALASDAGAARVGWGAVEGPVDRPVGPRKPQVAPAPHYEVRTPSMISTASVASTLNTTRDVEIT